MILAARFGPINFTASSSFDVAELISTGPATGFAAGIAGVTGFATEGIAGMAGFATEGIAGMAGADGTAGIVGIAGFGMAGIAGMVVWANTGMASMAPNAAMAPNPEKRILWSLCHCPVSVHTSGTMPPGTTAPALTL